MVKDKKKRTCQVIDMSISTERNTSLKTMEKLTKYKDLEIEIEKMWGMKTERSQWSLGLSVSCQEGNRKSPRQDPR